MPPRTLRIIFAVSLVVLVGVTVALATGGASDPGPAEAIEAALAGPVPKTTSTQAVASTTTDTDTPDDTETPPAPSTVPVRSGVLSENSPVEGTVPVGLTIPSIDVEAPVIATGVDARTGQMEVPNNVSDVAWYEFGPRPGEVGSAVLAAHVDLAGQGPGVFFDLRDVEPGDVVVVSFSDGSSTPFRVEARTVYKKDELPVDVIFSRQGPPVLTLVTCGGGFSESSRSYDSNVVVYAVPLEAETGDVAE